MKRIIVTSDFHCGHQTGLTPPGYRWEEVKNPTTDFMRRRNKYLETQRGVWKWFSNNVKKYGPFDYHFNLGDNTDGRGEKSGGTELITSDLNVQVEMAIRANEEIKAKKRIMVYGTPYHTCAGYSDLEDTVANGLNNVTKIGSREWVKVEGVTFDLKHAVGKSGVPNGQGSPLAKEWMWNVIWNARNEMQPKADIFLRGHIHDYNIIGSSDFTAMSIPAFEWGTKFGNRICTGVVSIGFVVFEIDKENYTWEHVNCELNVLKTKAIVL